MTDESALRSRIAVLFRDSLHVDVVSTDADLFEEGILDSLAFVELLLELERCFGVTTSSDDLEADNFRTIDRIADYVMTRTAVVVAVHEEVATV